MNALPKCPKCNSEYTYQDGMSFICPECVHEWMSDAEESSVNNTLVSAPPTTLYN